MSVPLESGTWSVRPVLLSTSFENGHLHLERKWNKNGGRIICKQGSALSGTKLYIARCQSEAFRTIRYSLWFTYSEDGDSIRKWGDLAYSSHCSWEKFLSFKKGNVFQHQINCTSPRQHRVRNFQRSTLTLLRASLCVKEKQELIRAFWYFTVLVLTFLCAHSGTISNPLAKRPTLTCVCCWVSLHSHWLAWIEMCCWFAV